MICWRPRGVAAAGEVEGVSPPAGIGPFSLGERLAAAADLAEEVGHAGRVWRRCTAAGGLKR